MRMISFGRIGLCAAAVVVCACGCDTIRRAREAQAEVAQAAEDAGGTPASQLRARRPATPKGERVDLRGLRLVDYVA